jgi:hypothetical protein
MATYKKLALCSLALVGFGLTAPAYATDDINQQTAAPALPSWLPQNDQGVPKEPLYIRPSWIPDAKRELSPRFTIPGSGCSSLAVALDVGKAGTTPCATPGGQAPTWDWIAVVIRSIAGSSTAAAPLTS